MIFRKKTFLKWLQEFCKENDVYLAFTDDYVYVDRKPFGNIHKVGFEYCFFGYKLIKENGERGRWHSINFLKNTIIKFYQKTTVFKPTNFVGNYER